ncbi:signal peptidase I [Rhodovulum sulfidophilum]|uniref:signal peptidase I n=1 Tax=Rhodovulum sulfidophilum TaxID=35806 RepID=UPI0005A7370C|nr:signal peptidase I [Rhodovulum sulfidophilum]ANB33031.1 S26 family signal peptidase [Rhodovulum sulfidophilum DSM 1374]ANB36879.1 S26 family signal peptidase [Rhodovulum sulfidophilum]MBL3553711.1 signal peptidase I [Rhodovulum sulfidophilum]MBL3560349.1 signal peptidase I [Rhodovulum sulfidophilum]MBL3565450.1 signal peptidase I [Rhodovulum sulfidophilum]
MAKTDEKAGGGLWETVKTIFWALLIAGVFRTLFFQPFWIPSGSMKDTLLIGDFLFVNKMAYGYSRYSCPFGICPFSGRILSSEPERGDVVVFRHPVSNSDYIKRLVGLPGDTVQMREGVLYINGAPVEVEPAGIFKEPYQKQGPMGYYPECENAPVGIGGTCMKGRSIETLPNGVSHDILNITDRGARDTTPVYTVPEGEYFVLGDNRDNSRDSRYAQANGGVGFVPAENLIGRADRIMFSSAGRSLFFIWTWRPDRFFKAIE